MTRRRFLNIPPLLPLLALLATAFSGCAGSAPLQLRSAGDERVHAPDLPFRVYRYEDSNTADIYFSNISEDTLTAPAALDEEALSRLTGSIVHIHLFVTPNPTSTPIASTASNVTVRYLLFVRGELGVYGGGGFMMPGASPGSTTYQGDMQDASLRLLQATPGFRDALGPSELSGSVRARLEERDADLVARFIERALRTAPLSPPGQSNTAQSTEEAEESQ